MLIQWFVWVHSIQGQRNLSSWSSFGQTTFWQSSNQYSNGATFVWSFSLNSTHFITSCTILASHHACTDCTSSCWELLPDSSIKKIFAPGAGPLLSCFCRPWYTSQLYNSSDCDCPTTTSDHVTTQLIWCIEPLCIPLHTNSCTDCKYWLTVSGEGKSKQQHHQQ